MVQAKYLLRIIETRMAQAALRSASGQTQINKVPQARPPSGHPVIDLSSSSSVGGGGGRGVGKRARGAPSPYPKAIITGGQGSPSRLDPKV
jgi:hypothetical protein